MASLRAPKANRDCTPRRWMFHTRSQLTSVGRSASLINAAQIVVVGVVVVVVGAMGYSSGVLEETE